MGLQNSAQSFQRHIDDVLKDVPGCFVYLDDVLLYHKTEAEHMKALELVLQRLDANGLTVSLSKCEFGKDKLDYLGYTVDNSGITPIKKKILALEEYLPPLKQKQLLGFLGAVNYYRSSLPKSNPSEKFPLPRSPAQILDPLYKLATSKEGKTKFKKLWEEHPIYQESFQEVKNLLVRAITLNFPRPDAPLALTTDASQTCLGEVLDQYVDGQWRPLGMWSKMLNPSQQKYTTFKRELLAIKFSMRHFNKDFNGRNLVVYTDHRPILGCFQSNSCCL